MAWVETVTDWLETATAWLETETAVDVDGASPGNPDWVCVDADGSARAGDDEANAIVKRALMRKCFTPPRVY
jgi:sugar lactone lactonase YvrE